MMYTCNMFITCMCYKMYVFHNKEQEMFQKYMPPWKSIGIIYLLGATPAPSLVLIKWRGRKILSGQYLVYRLTDSCKTICPLFQGVHKNWIEISMGKKAFPISDFQNMYAIIYAPLYLNLSSTQNPLLTLSLILKSE